MRFAHGVLWKWLPSRRSDATSIFLVLIALPWVSAQPPPPGPHEESGDGDEVSHDHHDHGRGGGFLEEWLGGDFASFSFWSVKITATVCSTVSGFLLFTVDPWVSSPPQEAVDLGDWLGAWWRTVYFSSAVVEDPCGETEDPHALWHWDRSFATGRGSQECAEVLDRTWVIQWLAGGNLERLKWFRNQPSSGLLKCTTSGMQSKSITRIDKWYW